MYSRVEIWAKTYTKEQLQQLIAEWKETEQFYLKCANDTSYAEWYRRSRRDDAKNAALCVQDFEAAFKLKEKKDSQNENQTRIS